MAKGERLHTNGIDDVPKHERCALAHCPLSGKGDKRCDECSGPVQWKDRKGHVHGVHRACTNCPMNGKGLDVCIICPGPNMAFASDGESMVSLGSFADPSSFIDANLERDFLVDEQGDYSFGRKRETRAEFVTALSPETEDCLLRLLRIIASLSKPQLLALHGGLNGWSQSETARQRGTTKQSVSMAVQYMCRNVPELFDFFHPPKPKPCRPQPQNATPTGTAESGDTDSEYGADASGEDDPFDSGDCDSGVESSAAMW